MGTIIRLTRDGARNFRVGDRVRVPMPAAGMPKPKRRRLVVMDVNRESGVITLGEQLPWWRRLLQRLRGRRR